MTSSKASELNWTFKTVVLATFVSFVGLVLALSLGSAGVWPAWDYSEVIFGGLCGATMVHRRHPARPAVVLLVFVPLLSALLLLARVLFHLYVLGEPIEL